MSRPFCRATMAKPASGPPPPLASSRPVITTACPYVTVVVRYSAPSMVSGRPPSRPSVRIPSRASSAMCLGALGDDGLGDAGLAVSGMATSMARTLPATSPT